MKWLKLKTIDNNTQGSTNKKELAVVLYCHNRLERLDEPLRNDGRFDPQDLTCADGNDSVSTDDEYRRVMEIEDSEVLIIGSSCDNAFSSEELFTRESGEHVFGCVICYNVATHYLDCGHLYCHSCTRGLKKNNTTCCLVCRRSNVDYKYIFVTNVEEVFIDHSDLIVMTCYICKKIKHWMTDCSHLSCACYTRRCVVCHRGPIHTWTKLHLRI